MAEGTGRGGRGGAQESVNPMPTGADMVTQAQKKPTGILIPDAHTLLLNFYMVRPDVEPPEFLRELKGVHGWFFGNGNPEREIAVGFRPAWVYFIIPPFPDEPRGCDRTGKFNCPPIHDQPRYTDRGFMVEPLFNKAGEMTVYFAWKSKDA